MSGGSGAMSSSQRLRADLDAAMSTGAHGLSIADRLCHACVDVLEVDGAAISVIDSGASRGTYGSSGALSRRLDELQFTFGEGPCLDAVASGRPVLAGDLGHRLEQRWPAFAGAVLETGVRAVFALPISVAASSVGALDLFRHTVGPLDAQTMTGGLLAAELAALPLLDLMAGDTDWHAVGSGAAWPELASLERVEVYQATGMIMGQLDVSPAEALARLRAHAFAKQLTASEVAWLILDRQLVLHDDRIGRSGDEGERR